MISFTYEDNIAVNWDGDKIFNIHATMFLLIVSKNKKRRRWKKPT
jgi:hypothetical protein